jgi:hypothetical protein
MQMNQPAGDGERFTPDAFVSQVGKTVPVRVSNDRTVDGRVVAAAVAADGRSVEFTLDVDLDAGALSPGPMSFGQG